jgi:ATP synthase protein I
MRIIAPFFEFGADDFDNLPTRRLSAQQAQALREVQPSVSPWRILGLQALAGLVVASAAWALTGRVAAACSAGYGALAVVIPAMLFARGLMSQFSSLNAATAGFGFFVWEAVKIAVSVGMLFAAPQLVENLDWLTMLTGLVVTLKVYWLALLLRPKHKID